MSDDRQDWDEEQRLVDAAKRGEEQARNLLLQRFEDDLRRYLKKGSGERLARYAPQEDLLQEVLWRGMGALTKLREGARPEEFKALLFQHAKWVLLNSGRRSSDFQGESVLVPQAPAGESAPPRVADPGEPSKSLGPVTLDDRNRWLRQLVGRLEEKYAAVLRLYLEGRGFAEIAAELDISEEAARKRFLRAARQAKDLTTPSED